MSNLIQWPRAQYWNKPWNPMIGCKPCSPACDNCYAAAWAKRFGQSFKPHDPKRVTVGEIEKLQPDSEYIKCYKALAAQGHCKYDPDMRYGDLPALLHKHAVRLAQLEALHMAFADVERGVSLWDIGGLGR